MTPSEELRLLREIIRIVETEQNHVAIPPRGGKCHCRQCNAIEAYRTLKCPKGKVPLSPGVAIQQTYTGSPDFIGGECVTMSPGGPGKLVDCLKCRECGFSVAKGNQ